MVCPLHARSLMQSSSHREWYRTVLDSIAAPVMVERRERILYANPALSSALGYKSPAEIAGRHISGVIAPVDRDRLVGFGRERVPAGASMARYPFTAQKADGTVAPFYASVTSMIVDGECLISWVLSPMELEAPGDERLLRTLSPRERVVFDLLVRGERQKQIAFSLGISAKTVATLRGRLMRKLRLSGSWELFHFAQRFTRRQSAATTSSGSLTSIPPAGREPAS